MRQEFIVLGDKRYCYVDQAPNQGQPKGTFICLHGFPDQWYGWEKQIAAWSQAGYRVIVPHMLGYGQSEKSSKPSSYSPKSLCHDIDLLLDGLQLTRVIMVGHDWGAMVAWRFALWYPHRITALVALSIPYFPPETEYVSPSERSKRFPAYAYQEYFADPNSTQEIDANLDIFLPALFQGPRREGDTTAGPNLPILRAGEMQALLKTEKGSFKLPPMVIPTNELERYMKDFQQGGMNGPLSYYRNSKSRYDDEKELPPNFPASIPTLFIYGTKDSTCPQGVVARMPDYVANLKVVPLQDKWHWLMHEASEEVNSVVLDFLETMRGIHDAEQMEEPL